MDLAFPEALPPATRNIASLKKNVHRSLDLARNIEISVLVKMSVLSRRVLSDTMAGLAGRIARSRSCSWQLSKSSV